MRTPSMAETDIIRILANVYDDLGCALHADYEKQRHCTMKRVHANLSHATLLAKQIIESIPDIRYECDQTSQHLST